MYTIYTYSAGATQANLLLDLVAILTGTTDPNSLSASCNKSLTTITATTPAGWTLHDANSGTNKQVIKSPCLEGLAYKYAEISLYSTTAFTMYLYEDFNNSTHTGTNITANSTNYAQQLNLTDGGKIYIFSSARYCALVSETTAYGDSSRNGITLCTEFKPLCPWANGYPPAVLIFTGPMFYTGSTELYLCRAKGNNNVDRTGSNAKCYGSTIGCSADDLDNSLYFPDAKTVYDNSGVVYTPFMPLFVTNTASFTIPVGDVSACADIWLPPNNLLTQFTTATRAGLEYVAVRACAYISTGFYIFFPK